MKRNHLQSIVISAFLVALGVIFSRFLSVPLSLGGIYSINLGFGTLPILLLAVLFGPFYGAIGAAAWDLIGAILFPHSAFNPAFTISAALFGLIVGLFFIKPGKRHNVLYYGLAIAVGLFMYTVVFNTALLCIFYDSSLKMVVMIPRLIKWVILTVISTGICFGLVRLYERQILGIKDSASVSVAVEDDEEQFDGDVNSQNKLDRLNERQAFGVKDNSASVTVAVEDDSEQFDTDVNSADNGDGSIDNE